MTLLFMPRNILSCYWASFFNPRSFKYFCNFSTDFAPNNGRIHRIRVSRRGGCHWHSWFLCTTRKHRHALTVRTLLLSVDQLILKLTLQSVSTISFNFSFYTHARVTRTRRSTSNLAVALKRLYLQKPLHKSWIAEKCSLAVNLHNANVNFALLNCSLQRADHDYQRLHCFVELFRSDRTRSDDCDQDVFLTRQWQAFFETYVA